MEGDRPHTRPARVFVGRLHELDALGTALAAARTREPQVVLIQGEGGIGKSSLILEFLASQPGLPAIIASGDAAEAALNYGLVQQLATGTATATAARAPARRMQSTWDLHPDADPLAVGVKLRALISSLPSNQATALVIEDLQWADPPSARALLFACRRLDSDQVLVILTCLPKGRHS